MLFKSWIQKLKSKPAPRRGIRHRRSSEPLESRILLTVSTGFDATSGAFTVSSDVDDDIAISARGGEVQVNGAASGVSTAEVQSISVTGGPGDNQIDLHAVRRDQFPKLTSVSIDGGAGNDRIDGSQFSDVINGGDGDDVIRGFRGHDTIDGGTGNDRLFGSAGHDVMNGGDGDDLLRGQGGHDDLSGGSGTDRLEGGRGRNSIHDDPIVSGSAQTIAAALTAEPVVPIVAAATDDIAPETADPSGADSTPDAEGTTESETETTETESADTETSDADTDSSTDTDDDTTEDTENESDDDSTESSHDDDDDDDHHSGSHGEDDDDEHEHGEPGDDGEGETELRARLTGATAATGSVSFEVEQEHGTEEREFSVRVRDAEALTTYDVSINGTVVGQITTDALGRGRLKLSNSPHGSEQGLPVDFVDPIAGDTITVGDILTGTFA